MGKYAKIDAIKTKLEELNTLIAEAQDSNFIVKLNIAHEFSPEAQLQHTKVVLAEAIYSERIDV